MPMKRAILLQLPIQANIVIFVPRSWRQLFLKVFFLRPYQLVLQVFFFCMVLIYNLCPATSLTLIYYAYFVDAGVQPDSLPVTAAATMAPPMAASIEIITTSSSTDPGVGPPTRMPSISEASLMFFFEGRGLALRMF